MIDEVVKENIGLVRSCISKFFFKNLDYDDVFQAGCIGLTRAAQKFDSSKGTKFSTYAVPFIFGEIKNFFHSNRKFKIGRDSDKLYSLIKSEQNSFFENNGRDPSLSEISETLNVSIEDINAANYNLSPAVYLNEIPDVPYGRPFEDVMISVQRGANITAKMLDGLVSAEPTAYRYMQISDIHEGKVDNNLQYLKTLDDKLEKYCVQDKDLIISKIASPGSTVKVAVANVPDDEKIVAAGNLYVIRVDQNIIDPYYLKAYLESATGTLFLKRAATGMTIPSISVSNLKKILVPVPPIEEQTKVVDEYMSICDEIELLRRRMDQAYERLHNVFDANIEEVK